MTPSPAAASPLLSVRNVSRRFGGLKAVDDMSFDVAAGTAMGIIGPNGAGKTTMFNLVSGFEAPDQGSITFRGQPIHGLRPHRLSRLGIGRTFQTVRIFKEMTVSENLRVAHMHGAGTASFEGRAAEVLDLVGMTGFEDRRAGQLSYGQQKLVEIAMVLVTEPTLLLLDEPVSGVNPILVERFAALLRTLRDRGITLLLVEHNVPFVAAVCDVVLVMAQGARLAEGSGDEVQRDPRVLEAFLGG